MCFSALIEEMNALAQLSGIAVEHKEDIVYQFVLDLLYFLYISLRLPANSLVPDRIIVV